MTLKTALTTGGLSLSLASLPIAVGIVPTRIVETHTVTWIPILAILYTKYVSLAPEPFRLVIVGWELMLFGFLVRMVVRNGFTYETHETGKNNRQGASQAKPFGDVAVTTSIGTCGTDRTDSPSGGGTARRW